MSADAFFAKLAGMPKPFAFGLFPFGSSTCVSVRLGASRFAVYRNGFSQAGRLVGELQSGTAPLRTTVTADLRWNAKYSVVMSILFLILFFVIAIFVTINGLFLFSGSVSILGGLALFVVPVAIMVGQQSMVIAMARRDHDQLLEFLVNISAGEVRSIDAGHS
ncbi:hypothetical protein [Kaistia algarum]|uniref:hypothetical protein n=1 Tax=Kaistia algarum TaxID=2083279 RepID=UPI00105723E0|nr:hypothetical protein [Kaistia algarum]MCX5513361.1 hypothetical protein [Kaistia algarum]